MLFSIFLFDFMSSSSKHILLSLYKASLDLISFIIHSAILELYPLDIMYAHIFFIYFKFIFFP